MNATTSHATAAEHTDDEDHGFGHVVPLRVLLGVFLALLMLTALTVAAAQIDLGGWNLPVALAIATLKATLVALFFMHLWYDSPFNGFVFLVGLALVALFLALTVLDTTQYQPDVTSYQQQKMEQGL